MSFNIGDALLLLSGHPHTHFLHGLHAYQVSVDETRYFCRICGTHLVLYARPLEQFRVAAGAVEHEGNVIKITGHDHVEETKDDGLKRLLREAYLFGRPENLSSSKYFPKVVNSAIESEEAKTLRARCHCGGVEYIVTPPSDKSKSASSPWPDLLVPYHSGSSTNQEDVKRWLRCNDSKYVAGLCSCRSCRLHAGFAIQSWAFIPKANLEKEGSGGKNFDYEFGTLKRFESSPGVYREFCGCCGATVFWHCEERPHLVDVSVGLFRAESGA